MNTSRPKVNDLVRTTVTTRSSFEGRTQCVIEEGAEGRVVETTSTDCLVEFEVESGRRWRVSYQYGEVERVETGSAGYSQGGES